MKLYVVSRHIDYEGGEVIGVYYTQERAEQVINDCYKSRLHSSFCGIHYDWKEYEVEV